MSDSKNKNILHYTVGLNKNRGGGLSKYVDDLAEQQAICNNVIILYPGEYGIIDKRPKIKKEKKINNIKVYSIKNPLSLPMMFGLQDMDYLYKRTNIGLWKTFFIKNEINIIHMHTMIGIFEEFVLAAVELKIPILYTTHDYFGLCPKQTFIFDGKICDNWQSCENCPKCNSTAFSKFKTVLIHTKLFCYMRKFNFFKKIKMKQKKRIDNEYNIDKNSVFNEDYYKKLRNKMINIFNKIDLLHFNSSVSKMVFQMVMPNIKGEVLNITHRGILDNRKRKKFDSKNLRVTYLGPTTAIKGFDDIINAIDHLYSNTTDIELNIYSYTDIDRPYLNKVGISYNYQDLSSIFENTDVLIAPSRGYETFGFTVAEALSYGVPVIVSPSVGAKDLIKEGKNGFVIESDKIDTLLLDLIKNREILKNMNHYICDSVFYTFEKHCEEIDSLYNKIISERNKE